MSDDAVFEMYKIQAELVEIKEELKAVREEKDKLQEQKDLDSSNSIKRSDDFQAKCSETLKQIQEDIKELSSRVSSNEEVLSTIQKISKQQSEEKLNTIIQNQERNAEKLAKEFQAKLSNILGKFQEQFTALSARSNLVLSLNNFSVSNNDETFSHINRKQDDTLSKVNEMNQALNNQEKDIQFLKMLKNSPDNKRIVVIGGWNGERILDSVLILQDNDGYWKELNIKLPYAICNHGAQFLNSNIYVYGGKDSRNKCLNSTLRLSKRLNWEKMADMNESRERISSSSVILNERIWVCGGYNDEKVAKNVFGRNDLKTLRSVEVYNPVTDKWQYMKEMNECRRNAAAAVVNGKIFCCGGHNGQKWLNSTEYYDPSSDIWILSCPMPEPCYGLGAVGADGNLIVMGGFNGGEDLCNVWILDTTEKYFKWIRKTYMPLARGTFGIVMVIGQIFVCGGVSHGRAIDNVTIFDGKVWRDGPKLKSPRSCFPAIATSIDFANHLK